MIGNNKQAGWQTYNRGLEGLVVGDSSISKIDGEHGKLLVRGYNIEDLAANSTFEEASYLVLHGELPGKDDLAEWTESISNWHEVPRSALQVLNQLPLRSHPLAKYRTALSIAACNIPEPENNEIETEWRRPARILAWSAALAAASIRHLENKPPIEARSDLGFAGNFLWQTLGRVPDEEELRAFEVSLVVQIEHGIHAAALAALTVFSTGTDLGSAVIAGTGALSGALHGGANQTAYQMISRFDKPGEAQDWVKMKLEEKYRFPGFGHRVYKTIDPRQKILEPYAKSILLKNGMQRTWEIYIAMKEEIEKALSHKGVFANVDSITGLIYAPLGLPPVSFPIPFCLAIQTGWMAHCLEYIGGRVIEPGAIYLRK